MDELERLREKKAAKITADAEQKAQKEEQVRGALMQLLEPDAYSRLMFIRAQNTKLFSKAVQVIMYLAQSGQMKGRVGDAQLRALLAKMAGGAREPSITFKRKGGEEEKL